jgi:threonine dehydrogenase-like Zn-dependent dehydrogenase
VRDLPPAMEGGVLVRTLYSGISRGTEALVFQGEVPPSQFEAMRAPFQEGSFPAPVKYGYCSVGRVEVQPRRRPPGLATEELVGRTVFSLHPHQDLYWVPPEAVTLLPPGLPPERAILGAQMETAVNAVWDGAPGPGDRVVVVGAGVIGLLVAWLCRQLPGCEVTLVDPNPARGPVARALGLAFHAGSGKGEGAAEEAGSGTADLVFHASGNPEGLVHALELAGAEATVVEVSWYGTRRVPLPLGEAFHSLRLTLRSSQVGRIPPGRAPRWDRRRRMRLALRLLQAEELDALISGESDFRDLPEVMARLSTAPEDTLCHRIRYPAP